MFIPGQLPSTSALQHMLILYLQILKPAEKKQKYVYGGGLGASRPVTPPRKQKK